VSVLFQKATKSQSMLRLALEGPAGYGKTYTALVIGTGLAKAAGSGSRSSTPSSGRRRSTPTCSTSTRSRSTRRSTRTVRSRRSPPPPKPATACVVDSLSHFWIGEGGTLDLVDQIARTKYKNDSHRAWKDAGEIQQRLTDAILRAPLHVIAAMRTKKDYVREEVDGKTKIRAAGTKTVQRDEFDYEFDLIGRFDTPTVMAIVKSRYADLPPETVVEKPGQAFVDGLIRFLGEGEALASAEVAAEARQADRHARRDRRHARLGGVAEKYAQREFHHGRDRLTEPEIGQTIIQFQAQLEKAKKPRRADRDQRGAGAAADSSRTSRCSSHPLGSGHERLDELLAADGADGVAGDAAATTCRPRRSRCTCAAASSGGAATSSERRSVPAPRSCGAGAHNFALVETNFAQKIDTGKTCRSTTSSSRSRRGSIRASSRTAARAKSQWGDDKPGDLKDKGVELASHYHRPSRRPSPRSPSSGRSLEVPGVAVPVVGRIDVDEAHRTIDLKTGAKREMKPDNAFQGRIYQLERPVPVEFHLATKTKLPAIYTPAEYPSSGLR
jgi:hypothetical protein